jgi:hypothetical protein
MIDNNPLVRSVARAIDGAISRAVHGANATVWNPDAEVERLRAIREKTLAVLEELTVAQAAWSPQIGRWSILQIADHLLLTEQMYLEQFQRLLQQAEDGRGKTIEISLNEVDVGIKAIPRQVVPLLEIPLRMFNLFVPHVVRETMVRYPIVASLNPRASRPREGLELGRVRRDLFASFEAMEEFFARPMPRDLDELTINHPIMGNNSIPQLFKIVIAHEERHQRQIDRIQAHPDFPRISQEPVSAARMAHLYGRGGI